MRNRRIEENEGSKEMKNRRHQIPRPGREVGRSQERPGRAMATVQADLREALWGNAAVTREPARGAGEGSSLQGRIWFATTGECEEANQCTRAKAFV